MNKRQPETHLTRERTGRREISDPDRGSTSKRAAEGIIRIIKTTCPFCGHKKAKENTSPYSPIHGQKRCTKCMKIKPKKKQ